MSAAIIKEDDPFVQYVDDFPLPSMGFSPDIFRQALQLPVQPGDIILSTFPKCGTTWTQYIVWGLLNDGIPPPSVNQVMFKDFPFIELMGPQSFLELQPPRLAKFHLPYDMTPKCPGARLIHVLRNPFDAFVSLWAHHLEIEGSLIDFDMTFDHYFETFMKGTCMFGDYFLHETSWYEHRDDPDVLFLTFEGMKKDPRAEITRIADFIGLGEHVRKDGCRLLNDVIKHSSFSYLKENCNLRLAKDGEAIAKMGEDYMNAVLDEKLVKDNSQFKSINFFRKGEVGSSREKLSADQWRRLEKAIRERVSNPELRALMMNCSKIV